jgi:hypothetical protein
MAQHANLDGMHLFLGCMLFTFEKKKVEMKYCWENISERSQTAQIWKYALYGA